MFMLLVLLLSAGYMSLKEYNRLGEAFKGVLKDNYESIKVSNGMLGAIFDEDKDAVQFLLCDEAIGETLVSTSHQTMLKLLEELSINITEKNEDSLVVVIQNKYAQFHTLVSKAIAIEPSKMSLNEYETEGHSLLRDLRKDVNELIAVNQNEIYNQSLNVSEGAVRALMPIMISTVASIAFVLILFYFLQLYLLKPLRRMIEGLKSHCFSGNKIDAKISSNNEMKLLENEINSLIERTQRK